MLLSESERTCLEYLALHPDSAGEACSSAVLEVLVAHGLLERHVLVPLPGLAWHCHYRLTAAGLQVLKSSG
ncbi:MAG: hypothetical protein AB1450_05475 [Pseudomonadota bacterium]